jgi:hypothetical protein
VENATFAKQITRKIDKIKPLPNLILIMPPPPAPIEAQNQPE